jgi:hypothetical protein
VSFSLHINQSIDSSLGDRTTDQYLLSYYYPRPLNPPVTTTLKKARRTLFYYYWNLCHKQPISKVIMIRLQSFICIVLLFVFPSVVVIDAALTVSFDVPFVVRCSSHCFVVHLFAGGFQFNVHFFFLSFLFAVTERKNRCRSQQTGSPNTTIIEYGIETIANA